MIDRSHRNPDPHPGGATMLAQALFRAALVYGPAVAGYLVAALGLVVLLGWQMGAESITRLKPWLPSMLPLTAFGFVVAGAGLVALHRRHRPSSRAAGGIALAIAAVGLFSLLAPDRASENVVESLPGAGVMQGAEVPPPPAPAPRRSPVPPNTAMAFALAGFALLLARRFVYGGALLGFGVVTLGAVALLGHVAEVAQAFGWGGDSYMAFHSAVAFLVLGGGIVLYSLEREARVRERRSWWRAGLVGASAAVAGVLFFVALRAQERDTLSRMLDATARGISSEMFTSMQSIELSLSRLVEHGLTTEWHSPEEWQDDARLTVGAFRGFESIEWIDAKFAPRIVATPEARPRELADTNQNRIRRERSLEVAHDTERPVVAGPFEFVNGGNAFRVIVPLRSVAHPEAYLSGVFSAEQALSGIAAQISYDYEMVFLCDGREIYRQGSLDVEHPGRWARRFALELPGAIDWTLVIAPTRDLLSAVSTPLPEVALGASLLIALLLVLTVRFGDMAIRRAASLGEAVQERTRELEESMANLRAEVAERRRTEAVLRRTQTLGRLVSAELDLFKVVQAVTDAATELTGAQGGCLVYTVEAKGGKRETRHVISGQHEVFGHLDHPEPHRRIAPAFASSHPIRVPDIRRDPRRGGTLPDHTPPGSPIELASFLAVPVVSRSGHEWGALQFGHASHGVFTERDEGIAVSLAAQAAIAMDNAALYEAERHANAEAVATNEAKDNFIHMLGHELRNPLGSIRNAMQVMAFGRRRAAGNGNGHGNGLPAAADSEDEARMHRIIDRQVDQLTRLVDDLLQVSQLSSNKLTLRPASIDLAELVGEAVEAVRARFEAMGLTVSGQCGGSAMVFADPHRIRQVLANLLENAGKFSDAGDEITVGLTRDEESGHAVVSVRDTGCGIDPKDLPRLFAPFVQTDMARDRMTGGLGLGLPIVRGLVEAQGGSVEIFSEGRDRGSEFRVRLPLQRGPVAPPVERTHGNGIVARRILVVDDHRDSADVLKRLLELSGNEVAVAYDGPRGVEVARALHPEVMICDIGLPGMDGFEVARRLGEDPETSSICMIALTGFGDADTIRAAREAGFRHHLTKPVETLKLERLLSDLG
jgi:signal transduction histidine kinase/sensor domain CHASE-containing protein